MRALKAGFIINMIGSVALIAVSLITIPLYIHHIGDARYRFSGRGL